MRDRHLESRMKLTACSETADVLRGFEQQNSLATFRQVGRADKAVVTGANDDGIVVLQWTLFPRQYRQAYGRNRSLRIRAYPRRGSWKPSRQPEEIASRSCGLMRWVPACKSQQTNGMMMLRSVRQSSHSNFQNLSRHRSFVAASKVRATAAYTRSTSNSRRVSSTSTGIRAILISKAGGRIEACAASPSTATISTSPPATSCFAMTKNLRSKNRIAIAILNTATR